MKEKLLFMGADVSTLEAINYAKSKGFYTIVTDFNPPEKKLEKLVADESWMIDLKDLDSIELRCRSEGISHIYAGTQEFCLDQCKKLSKRLGLTFYANDLAWKATRDKVFFKQICEECGLLVPRRYRLDKSFLQEDVNEISFPVIVKPADSCAQQGLSLVREQKALKAAYEKALQYSASGEVIVEDYIEGADIAVFCHIHKGRIILLGVPEVFPAYFNNRKHFGFYSFHSEYGEFVKESILPKLNQIVNRLGCTEGACTFQGVFCNHKLYSLEFGYRLDGLRMWRYFDKCIGLNQLEVMVDMATGIERPDSFWNSLSDHKMDGIDAGYVIWCKPGRIKKIIGRDLLYEREDLIFLLDNYNEGDTIPSDDNMRSIACIIHLYGKTQEELNTKMMEVNQTLHYYDQDNNEMLIYLDDYIGKWNKRYKYQYS